MSKRPRTRLGDLGAGSQVAAARDESDEAPISSVPAPLVTVETVETLGKLETLETLETLTFDAASAAASARPDETSAPPPDEHTPDEHTPDEMSIPPMGDLSVEPVAERFFSEGELVAGRVDRDRDEDEDEWDDRQNKANRKSLPEVIQRRVRFAKYVRWAVGGAAVVCLAALARTAISPAARSASTASTASLGAEGAALGALEAPASIDDRGAAAPAVVRAAAPAETLAAAPAEALTAAPPGAPKTEAADPATTAPPAGASDKTALQEKNDSRRSLERGKVADAIAAGERSVALDATDGEAWLLLGAAYQEKGNNTEAWRCYASCIKEGKRGPVAECRAMLR